MKDFLTKEDLYGAATVIGFSILAFMFAVGIYMGLTEGIPVIADILNSYINHY